jgi:hypothetical protein
MKLIDFDEFIGRRKACELVAVAQLIETKPQMFRTWRIDDSSSDERLDYCLQVPSEL